MKYAEFEAIKTPHLLLRQLRSEDAEHYYNHITSSEDVARYMLWQPHASQQEAYATIERIIGRYKNGNCYSWGIALSHDNSIIGRIDLLRFDEASSSCSFAYMIGKEFWGHGYGTEALNAVFAFAFDKMELQSIVADHICENTASGRVMQKAGMHYVCRHIAKYEKGGKHYDAEEYLITADEWRDINKRSR